MSSAAYIIYIQSTPGQLRDAISSSPYAYVPLGALEWHGEQNPLGLDSIKAQRICEMAASITGGVVFPVMQWGAYDTLNFPYTFRYPPSLMRKLIERTALQLRQMGFRVVVMLSGHYPPSQIRHLRRLSFRLSKRLPDFFLLGFPEFILTGDIDYLGDHAACWETSMMMAIEESLVDIGKLPHGINFAERAISHGVFGRHPGECASAELGRKALDMISSRTAGLVRAVDESGSIEPYKAALKEFDKLYFRTFNPFSLKRLFMLQGISSAREGWEYLKWITLRNGRCETDYHYPGK